MTSPPTRGVSLAVFLLKYFGHMSEKHNKFRLFQIEFAEFRRTANCEIHSQVQAVTVSKYGKTQNEIYPVRRFY